MCQASVLTEPEAPIPGDPWANLSGRLRRPPALDSGLQDTTNPGRPRHSESQYKLHFGPFTHAHTHTHTLCYFIVLTGGIVHPTLSNRWSMCAHPPVVAVLHVPHCATTKEAHGEWCTVRDMIHKVKAEPLVHWTKSAGLETVENCQGTSHPPHLQVGSTCYGSGTVAPSVSHLPREGYPLKQNRVVEAPCQSPFCVTRAAAVGGWARMEGGKESRISCIWFTRGLGPPPPPLPPPPP